MKLERKMCNLKGNRCNYCYFFAVMFLAYMGSTVVGLAPPAWCRRFKSPGKFLDKRQLDFGQKTSGKKYLTQSPLVVGV